MSTLSDRLRHLPGELRRAFPALLFDALVVLFSYAVAMLLRFAGPPPEHYLRLFLAAIGIVVVCYSVSLVLFGIYSRAWEYAGIFDLVALTEAVALSTLLTALADVLLFPQARPLPLSVIPTGGAITLLCLGLARLWPRVFQHWSGEQPSAAPRRVLIVGCGQTGQLLAREFLYHPAWNYQPVCFVDDDVRKRGTMIHGLRVVGTSDDIPAVVQRYAIDVVAIAIPSAPGTVVRRIVSLCEQTQAKIQIVPSLLEIMRGQASATGLREVTITDLLGREQVEVDFSLCSHAIAGKRVMVTGAAGSVGSELARQLLALAPAELVLLDNNESGLHDLGLELAAQPNGRCVRQVLADVTVEPRLERVFALHRPEVIFHAAAYKHLPILEEHPEEAVRVNIGGTYNLCRLAARYETERFVLVSTDKAVRPTSVYGASKRVCELLVQAMARRSRTVFCAVRFGNVIGSRGSVVPTFLKQIEAGGPVTITHPDSTRYFMTIPEAASLVIQAAAFARTGEVYMLDMGEQVRIQDLALKMLRLKGLRPGVDIQIEYVGLRPGEKLHEELTLESERTGPTRHPKIFLLTPAPAMPDFEGLLAGVQALLAEQLVESSERLTARLAALLTRAGPDEAQGLEISIAGAAQIADTQGGQAHAGLCGPGGRAVSAAGGPAGP
jgi:FlaA1/EpsC-like NDP-sugar epimerase